MTNQSKDKLAQDFENAVKARGIKRWDVHNCSMCGYKCGYIFQGDKVYYDPGCLCVEGDWSDRTYQDVASLYNMQKSPRYIKEMDKFWGFTK